MRRRDVLAGVGSLGVLGGAGVLATRRVPSFGNDATDEPGADGPDGTAGRAEPAPPFDVETIDAPGSEVGTITVPGANDVLVVMYFMPTCGVCQQMMPVHGRVRTAVDEERVTFLGALHPNYVNTTDMTAEELARWWDDHDGQWSVGVASTELVEYYGVYSHPITSVLDADGEVHLNEHGLLEEELIVDSIEDALEGIDDDSAPDDESTEDSDGGST